jgi:pimeloyl-ACP methyl ester carboxylesterase
MAARTPLVLLPGLNLTARLWQDQIEALSDIAEPFVPDLTRHDRISDLARSVLEEAPRRFALAGLSMGGYVAFEILRQAPERVERLALLNTQARADTPEATDKRRRLIELARSGEFERALTVLSWTDLVARTRSADDSLEAVIYGMAEEVGPEGFVRQELAIIHRIDSRPTLGTITCPTLVVAGDDDRIIPPALSEEMASGIAGAQLEHIADCGHLSAIERPEAVSAAMRRWLVGERA